jgi:hypothetical protein
MAHHRGFVKKASPAFEPWPSLIRPLLEDRRGKESAATSYRSDGSEDQLSGHYLAARREPMKLVTLSFVKEASLRLETAGPAFSEPWRRPSLRLQAVRNFGARWW